MPLRVSDRLASAWLHGARAAGVGRVQSAPDSFTATNQTIDVMVAEIRTAARDALVRQTAADAAARFRGGPFYRGGNPLRDPAGLAASCFWWAKHHIRFVPHDVMIRQLLNESGQLQLLIAPDVLVRMEDPRGDCANFTELICAFLACLGVRWEIVTVAANPREPGVFSHVYPRAILPDGSRLTLDASTRESQYPGWQVPRGHTSRVQVWDAAGRPVPDLDSRWSGLHGYQRPGLGDASDTTTFIDTSSGWFPAESQPVPVPAVAPVAVAAPAPGGGFNWGSLIGNLANSWTQIGSRVLAPSTTVTRGANGSLQIVTPGNSPVGSALIGASAGAGAGLPSGVMWLGVALVAVLFIGSRNK